MGNARMSSKPTKRGGSLSLLCIILPLVSVALVAGAFIVSQSCMPEQWVVHVDGYGNVTYGSWWALFGGVLVLAGLAFLLGQYLARDFTDLGHWYHQQKGIVVTCFSLGFAMLGFFVGNIFAAWWQSADATAETSIGYGLLSFVLVAIVTAILYTRLLPKAQQMP